MGSAQFAVAARTPSKRFRHGVAGSATTGPANPDGAETVADPLGGADPASQAAPSALTADAGVSSASPVLPAAFSRLGDVSMDVPMSDTVGAAPIVARNVLRDLSWSVDDALLPRHAAFLRRCGTTPFDTAAWIEACKAAAPDRRYAFVTATNGDGTIAALFPFARRTMLGVQVLTWAAQDWADYCSPTVDDAILPDIAPMDAEMLLRRAVQASDLRPDALCLRKHPEASASRPNAFFSLCGTQLESDSGHHLLVGPEWPTLLKEKVSKRSRQVLRRKRRMLEQMGKLDFVQPDSDAQAETWADLMISWKRAQVRQRGGTDHFGDPAGLRVITASIRSKAGAVFALTLDERPIAICYTIEAETPSGPTRLLYQTSIDLEGPTAASPGVILLHELLETSCRDGFEYFDFGMGDEAYKAQWVETSFALGSVHRAVTAKGVPMALLLKGAMRVRRVVKSHPGLFCRVTAIRARVRSALGR